MAALARAYGMETRLRTQSTNFEHSPVAPANQSQQTNFGARQAAARIVTCGNRNVRFDIVTSTVAAKAGLANSQLNIPHSNHGTVILPTAIGASPDKAPFSPGPGYA